MTPGIARQIQVSARRVCPCVAHQGIARICCPSVAPDRDSTILSKNAQRPKWRISVLFHWLEVVPGGGIEPPTRGFSIFLGFYSSSSKLVQSIAKTISGEWLAASRANRCLSSYFILARHFQHPSCTQRRFHSAKLGLWALSSRPLASRIGTPSSQDAISTPRVVRAANR